MENSHEYRRTAYIPDNRFIGNGMVEEKEMTRYELMTQINILVVRIPQTPHSELREAMEDRLAELRDEVFEIDYPTRRMTA